MKIKRIIVANWKMNPRTTQEARKNFLHVKKTAEKLTKVQTVITPPFIFLESFSKETSRRCALGAQDVFWKKEGSYTGEISPAQLYDLNVTHVILGHSERRRLGESDEIIRDKIKAALEYRLNVILCIGESERDTEGHYLAFLKNEIKKSLERIPKKQLARLIVAYEPIWAVGAKAKFADTPESLFETSIFIRKILSDTFSKKIAFQVPILYGGSVTEHNAENFLKNGGVDGLLVGRASLDFKEFSKILKIAQNVECAT
tara:strand:+ start:1319 stop:2095 length:777 start_codon:yes stop_codon:yes gene_type:complete